MSDIPFNSDVERTKSSPRGVRVWDLPVRIFHWGLVLAVTITLVTGFLAPEWRLDIHVWAGYAIALLVTFRLLWGLYGSRHARFASFVYSPKKTIEHIKGVLRGKSAHYSGHNPAGAVMVFALLVVLATLTVSGIIILGGQENLGPAAGFIPFSTGVETVSIHRLVAYGLLFLIAAHVIGMLVESHISRENLARAMITGRKQDAASQPIIMPNATINSRALVIVVIVGLTGGGAYAIMSATPASGIVKFSPDDTYASECGDCHYAYNPSLLPRNSWQGIMAGLDDHFGEDASLDSETANSILAYLNKYSSEAWDSEAANNLRIVSVKNPLSITATAYWRRRHGEIDKKVFEQSNIGSKGNCVACHRDADSGRFDDAAIFIPAPPVPPKT